MDQNTSEAAPDSSTIVKFVLGRAWKPKWLIGAAAIAAAILTFALHRPAESWTGRMKVTIGEAPPLSFVLQSSGPSLAPLETPRTMVARLSDKHFRETIGNSAAFAPQTAAMSKQMVISSLRGIILEDVKEVVVELSAGSQGDVRAALDAVGSHIQEVHSELLDRSLRPLRARIEDARARVATIEKSNDELNKQLLNSNADEKSYPIRPKLSPTLTEALPAWNTLKDRIQSDENIATSSRPTRSEQVGDIDPTAVRSTGLLTASILAGLLILIVTSLLFAALGAPRNT